LLFIKIPQNKNPVAKIQQGKIKTPFFFHPDYTVGFGISPNQPL